MDGGSIAAIVISSIVVLGGVFAAGRYIGSQVSTTPFATPGVPVLLKIFHYFLPYCLIFYTLLNDLVFLSGMYSPSVPIAFGAILVNWVFSKYRDVNIGKIQSDLCGIPGLSWLSAYELPQTTVFTSVILGYISMFNTSIQLEKGSEWQKIIPPWILLISFGLIQYFVMVNDECFNNFNIFGVSFVNWLVAFLGGAGLGALSGWGLSKAEGLSKASSGSPSFTSAGPLSSNPPMAKSSDPNVGTCSPPNDQDQFVCEAYKNGELVTSTITEGFIGK